MNPARQAPRKKSPKPLIIILLLILVVAPAIAGLWFLISNRTNGKIISSGETRLYLLYVPESYDPGSPTPLVFNIHGYAQWPANQKDISNWNDLADEEGFIVVYPMGTGLPLHWATSAAVDQSPEAMKEVTFFSDLIDKLSTEYNIDPQRIYASGLSNGGGMSFMLSCTLADRIAAIGTVSGTYLYSWESCSPTRPVPLIAFHGVVDEIVPYYGGPSQMFDIPFPNIPDWMAEYARRNGCTAENRLPAQGQVTGWHFTGCNQNADVIFYTIADGGHSWPGGDPLPEFIVGKTSREIDATRAMWQFFQGHPLINQ